MSTEWIEDSLKSLDSVANGLGEIRREARERFVALGLPQTKQEEWKYTNLSYLTKEDYRLPGDSQGELSAEERSRLLVEDAYFLVFIDGKYRGDLSLSKEGVPEALKIERMEASEIEEHLARLVDFKDDALLAMNTAFLQEGVRIKCSAPVEKPVYCLNVVREESIASHPRLVVELAEGAKLSILEHYLSSGEPRYLTNTVAEYVLAKDAELEIARLQNESSQATHIANIYLKQMESSRFSLCNLNLGAKLSRTEIKPTLAAENISCEMSALNLGADKQHHDMFTVVDHAEPHCESVQNIKGIYSGEARGVFTGTIIVRPDAQKTNAIQSNQGLLLSDDASLDTRPQLKIWADDVKCTHGATVGQLDENALYYLRSRGLDLNTAKRLLVQAFAGDVFTQIADEELRAIFVEKMVERLGELQS